MAREPDPDDLVSKTETTQVSFYIPRLLSQRLDDLCKEINKNTPGLTIHRRDLIAALVSESPENADELRKLIDAYLNRRAWETLVGEDKGGKVIEFRQVKPGRRSA